MMLLQRFACFVLITCALCACATTQPAASSSQPATTVTGRGLFLLDFDYETGRVIDVHILKSTGDATLDEVSLKAFRRWRCKPHTYRQVKKSITFTLKQKHSP
jgi:hypothetical protein